MRAPVWSVTRAAAGMAAVLMMAFAGFDAPASAAPVKRLCKPRVEWTSQAATRAEAQHKALDGWAAATAGQYGDTFTKWAIAGIARVNCTQTLDGHRCRAAASPCRDVTDGLPASPPVGSQK